MTHFGDMIVRTAKVLSASCILGVHFSVIEILGCIYVDVVPSMLDQLSL